MSEPDETMVEAVTEAAPYEGNDLGEMERAIYDGRGVHPAAALRHIARTRLLEDEIATARGICDRWGRDPEGGEYGYWSELATCLRLLAKGPR